MDRLANDILIKFPKLRLFLSSIRDVTSEKNEFIILEFNKYVLCFEKGPLSDKRGIGRVAAKILERLEYILDNEEVNSNVSSSEKTKIYFFPSIYWCPQKLPDNSIILIHDVIPMILPEKFQEINRLWIERYSGIAKQASAIITISHSSAVDIAKYLNIDIKKIFVSYCGITKFNVGSSYNSDLPKEYIVYVGAYDLHKNLDVVLRALKDERLIGINLVIVGSNSNMYSVAKKYDLADRVHFYGYLPDDDVGHIISKSKLLVFPSLYEGFGLPPMEAALLGIPSVCSNRPAMTELLDGCAMFADPENPDDWALKISELLQNEKLRHQIAMSAMDRVCSFTWEASVDNIVSIIKGKFLTDNHY